MKYIACALLIVALHIPLFAHAETVLRIGDDIAVDADQVVNGDYYVSAGPFGKTSMSGSVAEDMYAFGGSVSSNGSIGGDLTIVSGVTQMHATVTDDVRIIAGEVTIAEHIGGDLFVIGGHLNVLSSASIDGDIIFFGGEAEINGPVGGSVLGTSERIRIDTHVEGDVDIKTATALTLGARADIAGSVRYTSPQPLIRAQDATIAGEVVANEYQEPTQEAKAKDILIPLFVTLFAAQALYLLFKRELTLLVANVHARPLASTLFGLGTLLLGPIVSVLLIATVLGALVGIAGLALTVLAYVLGYVLSGIVLGSYLSKLFTKKSKVSLLWVIVGTCVLYALLFIPVIGLAVVASIVLLTTGGIALSVYKLLA